MLTLYTLRVVYQSAWTVYGYIVAALAVATDSVVQRPA